MSTDTAVKPASKKGKSKKVEAASTVQTTAQKVVELKGQGMKPGEIATALGISASSVSQHLRKAGLTRQYTVNKSVQKVVDSLSSETKASMKADLVKQQVEHQKSIDSTKAERDALKAEAKVLGRRLQSEGAKLRSITSRLAAL